MKTVWLVIYFGRGDGAGDSDILREALNDEVPTDAHEAYPTEEAALKAVAEVLRDWCDEKLEDERLMDVEVRNQLEFVDWSLKHENFRDAIMYWNRFTLALSKHALLAFPIELREVQWRE